MLFFIGSNAAWSYQYSDEGEVLAMYSGADNMVGVLHSATWYNPARCANGAAEKIYLFDFDSTQDWSKVTSMLLTAYTAAKKIRIAPSPTKCFAGYPVIERVAFVRGL